jgi:RNA polymerase sigma factor (sigma-70 family)
MDGQCGSAPDGAAGQQLIGEAYRDQYQRLVRYLRTMVRDEGTAEDLAQEAFARLTREVHGGRVPENVPAWLFTVGGNLVVSHVRHAKVAARYADGWYGPTATSESPERTVVESERTEAVRDALAGLHPDHRAALLLAATGYRGPEIAERLGRSQLATRALICRARSRVRARLVSAGIGA